MRKCANILALLFGLVSVIGAGHLMAQDESAPGTTKFISDSDAPSGAVSPSRSLSPKEMLLRMGEQIHTTDLDCSHFVQWLFERAGLYYGYAPSRVLYTGMIGFERVFHPAPGDLVVWPGHVGIVVDPDEETFFSALRSGVKTSSYTSHYWKRRGKARFYRYLGWQSASAAGQH